VKSKSLCSRWRGYSRSDTVTESRKLNCQRTFPTLQVMYSTVSPVAPTLGAYWLQTHAAPSQYNLSCHTMATAHCEAEAARDDDANELEATELHDYQNGAHSRPPSSTTTAMDVDAGTGDLEPLPRPRRSGADVIGGFWKRHVVVTVPHDACRDHLGRSHVNDR